MMFVDNSIVLNGENVGEVNNLLDEWRLTHEGKGIKVKRNRTVYTEYDFVGRYQPGS